MNRKQQLFVGLFVAVLSIATMVQNATAGDYVWARSSWGSLPMGQYSSSFSNGYGGYYVRANAYGNNIEGRGRFTNPGGYIVPAQGRYYSVNRPVYLPVQSTHVQPSVQTWRPSKLTPNVLPPKIDNAVTNSTAQTAPLPPATAK